MLKLKKYISAFSFLLPCAAAAVTVALFRANTALAEGYCVYVFPALSYPFAKLSSLFDFSLTEILVLASPVLLVGLLAALIVTVVRSHNKNLVLKRLLRCAVWLFSVALLMFSLLHGCNYYRWPISQTLGLDTSAKTADEVMRVCVLLANDANSQRTLLNSDENGNMVFNEALGDSFSRAEAGFKAVSEEVLCLPAVRARPKPVINSHYWSYTGIVGMYFPFTLEANINTDVPQWTMPYTVCHELSHTLGYAKEDDAGFLAFLACAHHPDADYRYSGSLHAFLECVDSLRGYDAGMWEEAWSYLSADVLRDIRQNALYWKGFEGEVREVSAAVNDAFLKANGQSGGVLQYSQTAELILGYYKSLQYI